MYQPTPEEIKKAMAEVLSRRVFLPDVSADSIIVETKAVGQFYNFTIRLGRAYRVLPTPNQVMEKYKQTGKQGEGAKWLMFGALQIAGEKLRATARIVRTETAGIEKTAMGDGETSYEGLCKAFEKALLNLQISYVA